MARREKLLTIWEVLRVYKRLRGYSNARIARELGVTEGAIRFLMSGSQGRGRGYWGIKPRHAGERPLLYRVLELLAVEPQVWQRALLASLPTGDEPPIIPVRHRYPRAG